MSMKNPLTLAGIFFFLLVLVLFIYDYGTVTHSFNIHNISDYD